MWRPNGEQISRRKEDQERRDQEGRSPRRKESTTQEITGVGADSEKGEPSYTVDGMQIGAATLENSVEVPQKTKNRTTL